MKLQEFKDLCFTQWETRHGDITKLTLTRDSRKELETEMLLEPNQPWTITLPNEADKAAGFFYACIENPITRTPVKLETTSYRDFAEVVFPLDDLRHVPVPPG